MHTAARQPTSSTVDYQHTYLLVVPSVYAQHTRGKVFLLNRWCCFNVIPRPLQGVMVLYYQPGYYDLELSVA